MNESYCLRRWSASMYLNTAKKWCYGELTITPFGVIFTEDAKIGEILRVNFDHFIEMKKTKSSYIFGAIIIVTKAGIKYWFSSLPDRDGIYLTMLHFWRNRLTNPDDNKKCSSTNFRESSGHSNVGKALIRIAKDAEKTLENATSTLHNQGQQINIAFGTMHDLHHDLDIANNLVSGMESWLIRWRLPKKLHSIDPVVISESDIPDTFESEVLYTRLEYGKGHKQNIGLLRVASEGAFVLTPEQRVVHKFKWIDVSKIKVVSPWEVVITQYQIGQPDLSYDILSTDLIGCLKLFEKYGKAKLEYESPPSPSHKADSPNKGGDFIFHPKQSVNSGAAGSSQDFHHQFPGHIAGKGSNRLQSTGWNEDLDDDDSISATQFYNIDKISDADVEELTKTIERMKSMAIDVQTEVPKQNQTLDSLTDTVDRANLRLKKMNSRTNDLM